MQPNKPAKELYTLWLTLTIKSPGIHHTIKTCRQHCISCPQCLLHSQGFSCFWWNFDTILSHLLIWVGQIDLCTTGRTFSRRPMTTASRKVRKKTRRKTCVCVDNPWESQAWRTWFLYLFVSLQGCFPATPDFKFTKMPQRLKRVIHELCFIIAFNMSLCHPHFKD